MFSFFPMLTWCHIIYDIASALAIWNFFLMPNLCYQNYGQSLLSTTYILSPIPVLTWRHIICDMATMSAIWHSSLVQKPLPYQHSKTNFIVWDFSLTTLYIKCGAPATNDLSCQWCLFTIRKLIKLFITCFYLTKENKKINRLA